MANIVPQCEEIEVLLDGNSLDGDIEVEEFNVPDLEILRTNANALCPPLNFELKVQSDGREMLAAVGNAAGKPNLQLEIRASIKGNYGESVPASWKCRGVLEKMPQPFMPRTMKIEPNVWFTPTQTLELNGARFYEHIINGEEKYYIDALKGIRRVDGVDQLNRV